MPCVELQDVFGLIAIHFPDKEKARHTGDCEPWVVLGGRELICFLGFSRAILTPDSDGFRRNVR